MALVTPKSSSFNPTDQELVLNFLYNKINGKPLPSEATANIHQYDDLLFGEKKPWQIWEAFGGDGSDGGVLYFFSIKKKKTSRSENASWKELEEKARAKPITVKEGTKKEIIGTKKSLVWNENNNSVVSSSWIIHEYMLHQSKVDITSYSRNRVLCKLFKNHVNHALQVKTDLCNIENKQSKQLKIGADTTNSIDNNDGFKCPEIGATAPTSTFDNGGWKDASDRAKRFKTWQPLQTQCGGDDDVGNTTADNERNITLILRNTIYLGSMPLHMAARGGSVDCVRMLLAWGADRLQLDSFR
ncbi:hypothetical protein PIB30_021484 [Stylosanthes scabra]|uniref:NAC domain-containing protein n=1 Tax=Stylosanthes scabra TaxID=79078 RepID=A0ABU6YAP6_9FABA|nr:hypothetical protein [Stylosanthes scabra]